MRAKVAKLGLAAVLAYGLFDAVTYTTFFVLAFLGYEKSTGKNPAANLKALLGVWIPWLCFKFTQKKNDCSSAHCSQFFRVLQLCCKAKLRENSKTKCKTARLLRLTFICFLMWQIVILMWTGNNVTRPFRVAGAAALAPAIDKGLKGIQEKLNLPSQMYAFALVVGSVAAVCFTIFGCLILSKWGK